MLKRTKVAATLGPSASRPGELMQLVRAGADAFLLDLSQDDGSVWQERHEAVREVEGIAQQPITLLVDVPSAEGSAGGEVSITPNLVNWIADHEIDYVLISVSQGSHTVSEVRKVLAEAGSAAAVMARLDHASNYRDIDSIIQAADGVVVTGTGLSELETWSIPVMQKMVARQCQIGAKPCLVGRGILSNMLQSKEPSNGEVFDIANVVFDHADAILLGAETAVGSFPTQAVEVVSKTVIATESLMEITDRPIKVGFGQPPNTAALAYSIRHILKMQEIAAVGVYSHSSMTARLIAKNWIDCPVLGLSDLATTVRQMGVYHGVVSRQMKAPSTTAEMLTTTTSIAKTLGLVVPGDRMIVVSELPLRSTDNANAFVIETIT
ncbi:Pyruvate kinase [Bremerella volcania]|uniref:pyruvate kinase n=1 Tax=Bremerella volcania TaxID=2527984 RepID=A0A518C929_9BACT|nr:pyruvate kinase [Bremerella volcania]QDU75720.1 Pyruvate kinase [Bremerella volcania]